jgi:hypothetical protein
VLNELGNTIDSFLTYWSSVTPAVSVPAIASSGPYLTPYDILASFANCLNAVNTEFSLGATAMKVPSGNIDKNNFQSQVNATLAFLTVLHGLKP